MINKITFSHNYPKLWEQKTATLLAVCELNFPADKNQDLIDYDTTYYRADESPYDSPGYGERENYKLRNGPYLQLIFIGDKHIPFCTIRPKYNGWCKDRLGYYQGKIGQVFNVVIKNDNNGIPSQQP